MSDSFLLQQYLRQSLAVNPEKTAITDGNRSLSYLELSIRSGRIARSLQEMGISRQNRVVLCLQRSVDCISAIIGVLKADAIYIPIDPKTPLARWLHIFNDAAPRSIVCDRVTAQVVKTAVANAGIVVPILVLCAESPQQMDSACRFLALDEEPDLEPEELPGANDENDIAYILYTSGSTGRPKGVMISHASVRTYIDWAVNRFNVKENDRILGTAPLYFDMSTFDIYCSLKAGATFCIASELLTLFPEKLVSFIEQQQITLWKGVASLLMYMARTGALRKGSMKTLKQILFAGESLPTKYLIEWMRTFPEKTFYNAYGPTETTGVSICYQVSEIPQTSDVHIPIGIPRENTGVCLLAENGREVLPGETGELCISGKGLAHGYLNDPESTARAFIQRPGGERIYKTGDLARYLPDGNLEYLGRKDRQLKLMGYRIEAEEIERAMMTIPSIRDTAVILADSSQNSGVPELIAFWEGEEEIEPDLIAAGLKRRLPPYMIPKRLIRLTKMPRNNRGKIEWQVLNGLYLDR